MSITNSKAGNLFTTFSLRGGHLRGCGVGAVRCAPFLTGMALVVVLGSMVALSTPALAMGGGGGGGGSAPAPKVTKVDDPVAKPKDEVAEVKNPVVGPKDKTTTKPDERTAGLPKSNGKPAGTNDETGTPSDETDGVGDSVTEPENETPEVGELTAKGPEEKAFVDEDPVDKPDTKPEDKPAETDNPAMDVEDPPAETEDKFEDETGAPGDETVDADDDDTVDEIDYVRADIGFATSTSNVEEGDTLGLRIRITKPLPRSITVELSILFGAQPGVDVGNIPDSLTFAPGETIKDLNLAIIDDTQPEDMEVVAFYLNISPESYRYLPDGLEFDIRTHTITIIDNDGAEDEIMEVGDTPDEVDDVEVRVGFATSASEVKEGGTLSLQIQLSKAFSQPVTVSVTQLVHEFTTISDSLTFAPGETSKILELVIADPWLRGYPTYILGGVNLPDGVGFGQLVHRVTIIEDGGDDVAVADEDAIEVSIGFSTSASELKEGESMLLHVQLSEPVARDLRVLALAPVGDVVISSGYPDVVFREGETSAFLEITAVDDEQSEGTETVTYTLWGLGDGVYIRSIDTILRFGAHTHTVTIIDDDNENGQVAEVGNPVEETEDDTGGSAPDFDGETFGTKIATTAKTTIETFPALRWINRQLPDGRWGSSWGVDGTVTNVVTSGTIDGGSVGVRISHTGKGQLVFVNDADIDNVEYGIQAISNASGRFGITNNAKITDVVHGIDARYSGAGSFGVSVGHDGILGDRGFPSSFAHPIRSSEITALQRGVFAQHGGSGLLAVKVKPAGKVVSKENDAVVAEHNGAGKVSAYIEGEVRGARTGVVAKHNNKGNVEVYVRPGGNVHGDISAIIAEGEEVLVDLAGEVTGGSGGDDIAVDMGGTSRNILRLRPGFSSDGRIVVRGEGRSGSLVLHSSHHAYFHPTKQIGYLNLGDFRGFDVFELDDYSDSEWRVTGAVSDGEAFQKAFVRADSTLRFTDVDFKMAEWVHKGGNGRTVTDRHGVSWTDEELMPRSSWGQGLGTFVVDRDAALEIVGDNVIRGNLLNREEGYTSRAYSRIQRRYPHLDLTEVNESSASFIVFNSVGGEDMLAVTGDYKGHGFLIFGIGLDGWENDKLTIEGSTLGADVFYGERELRTNSPVLIGTPEEGTPSLGEESSVLIEVRGFSEADAFFGAQDVGAFRYVLEHEAVGEVVPDLDSAEDDFEGYHTWRFRRNGPSALAVRSSALAPTLSKSGAPLETPSGSHKDRDNSGLGFRANTGEYAGGVWGQRQSLRASQDLGVIDGGSSRTSGERIHFGYDTPAMNFMGGDVVVGANMWYGTSTSDVSSSIGTSGIDVRSQAAALTASWWSPKGLYASGQTQYVRFLSDVSADGLSLVKDNEGVGITNSAELGYRFAVPLGGMDFEVAPQVQLVWSHVGFDDFAGLQGELVSLEDGDLVTGRLGLSWDGEWQGAEGFGRIYGGMNLRGAVDGKTSVKVSGVSVASEQKGLSVDGKLGLSYEWNEGYAVYGETSAMRHEDVDEIRADLGVRIDF